MSAIVHHICILLTVRPLAFPMSVWTWPGLTERKTTWKWSTIANIVFIHWNSLLCHQKNELCLTVRPHRCGLQAGEKLSSSHQECQGRSTWWAGSKQTLSIGRRWPCKSWTHLEGSWVMIESPYFGWWYKSYDNWEVILWVIIYERSDEDPDEDQDENGEEGELVQHHRRGPDSRINVRMKYSPWDTAEERGNTENSR